MFLLIDFGVSRIKTALTDNGKSLYWDKEFYPFEPSDTGGGVYEISIKTIENKFKKIVDKYLDILISNYFNVDQFKGILLSCEMGGFALVDEKGRYKTSYISWKDNRDENYFNPNLKQLSFSEIICRTYGRYYKKIHRSMYNGLKFKSIPLVSKITDDIEVGGYVIKNDLKIPIYIGIGDHQCAILGVGNNENTLSINMGTGSQISLISSSTSTKLSVRPFFNGKHLECITHIPSGRALNEYIGFVETITYEIDIWEKLSKLTLEDLNNSTLKFDLAIFEKAINFNKFSGISNIREGNFTLNNYLSSLIRSYADQYVSIIKEKQFHKCVNKVILSGGIPRKLKILGKYFEQELGLETEVFLKGEETLYGLMKLSKEIR